MFPIVRDIMDQFVNSFAGAGAGVGQQQVFGGNYERNFMCYSFAFKEGKEELEYGDKILLPPIVLHDLGRMEIKYPIVFQVSNPSNRKRCHCGVLEFSSEPGVAYIPAWMMHSLDVKDGGRITLKYVELSKGGTVVFQPYTSDFTKLSNPRVILEKSLRSYTCLTKGMPFRICSDGIVYDIDVVDVKPDHPLQNATNDAIIIVEADCKAEFAAAKDADFVEESKEIAQAKSNEKEVPWKIEENDDADEDIVEKKEEVNTSSSDYFSKLGKGHKMKSKKKKKLNSTNSSVTSEEKQEPIIKKSTGTKQKVVEHGNWRYIYEISEGTDQQRLLRREAIKKSPAKSSTFTPFSGKGHSLV